MIKKRIVIIDFKTKKICHSDFLVILYLFQTIAREIAFPCIYKFMDLPLLPSHRHAENSQVESSENTVLVLKSQLFLLSLLMFELHIHRYGQIKHAYS